MSSMSARKSVPGVIAFVLITSAFGLIVGCAFLFPPPSDGTETGACCATDGTCSVTTQADCESAGGTYQGDDTSCSPNPCEATPDGATLFANNCSACHGSDGSGPPDITGSTAAELSAKIDAGGLHATYSSLTDAEIAAIASFLGG
jgi:cytochrome c5